MVQAMTYWSRSSQLLIEKAIELKLKVDIINKNKNLFEISSNKKTILFKSTDFGENSSLSLKIANDKGLTYDILKKHNLPTTETHYVNKGNYQKYLSENTISYPCVIKPLDDGHGNGVETNINNLSILIKKLDNAFTTYKSMVIQKQISGEEFRFMVLRGKVIGVFHRIPASVTGDGIHTINELIQIENTSNNRGEGYTSQKSIIKIDSELRHYLQEKGFVLDSILDKGEHMLLRGNSNLGTGGDIINVTKKTHPEFFKICEQVTNLLNMGLCGVDIMCQDISEHPDSQESIILEINATPGIFSGKIANEDIAEIILKTLFEI